MLSTEKDETPKSIGKTGIEKNVFVDGKFSDRAKEVMNDISQYSKGCGIDGKKVESYALEKYNMKMFCKFDEIKGKLLLEFIIEELDQYLQR